MECDNIITSKQHDSFKNPLIIVLNWPNILFRHADTTTGSNLSLSAQKAKLVTQQSHRDKVPTLRKAAGYGPFPHSSQRNKKQAKRQRCTSQPLKARPSNKEGCRSLAHITHERAPADTLLTWGHRCQNEGHNPWELLTPLCLDMPPLL